MPPLPLFIVDAFTAAPFRGNPAAICFLDQQRSDSWHQALAAEMNLSETAFLMQRPDGAFDLRWFTPTVEVSMCGHATLAAAHALWESNRLASDRPARFHTKSGLLTVARRGEFLEMDFPAKPVEPAEAPFDLLEALAVRPSFVASNAMDYLLELESESTVRSLRPDFARLAKLPVRGTMVTARATDGSADFVSRFFAPGAGIMEDPVTGSAHCALGPYWGKKLGKTELIGHQISPRGGIVHIRLANERVLLTGQAVTVVRGELSESALQFCA